MAKGDSGASATNSSLTNYTNGSPFMKSRMQQPMQMPNTQMPMNNQNMQPTNGIGPRLGAIKQPDLPDMSNMLNTTQPVSIAPFFTAPDMGNLNQAQPIGSIGMANNNPDMQGNWQMIMQKLMGQ